MSSANTIENHLLPGFFSCNVFLASINECGFRLYALYRRIFGVFRGLKLLVTPLLAELLESESDKIMTFDKFFRAVQMICGKWIITVFHVAKCTLLKVYMNGDEK
jgi:hypothetical protein